MDEPIITMLYEIIPSHDGEFRFSPDKFSLQMNVRNFRPKDVEALLAAIKKKVAKVSEGEAI